jgi:hypothetical protein
MVDNPSIAHQERKKNNNSQINGVSWGLMINILFYGHRALPRILIVSMTTKEVNAEKISATPHVILVAISKSATAFFVHRPVHLI